MMARARPARVVEVDVSADAFAGNAHGLVGVEVGLTYSDLQPSVGAVCGIARHFQKYSALIASGKFWSVTNDDVKVPLAGAVMTDSLYRAVADPISSVKFM